MMEATTNTEGLANNTPRSRQGISEMQKKELRSWFRSQQPRPSHAACMAWFQSAYGRKVNQSTVSLILSKRYEYLDTGPASSNQRQYTPQWPILEKTLSDWLGHVQASGERPSGDAIIHKARELFPEIPEYEGQATPQFSQGWLSKFRKRHVSRVGTGPDEETVAANQNSRKDLRTLRAICGEFIQEDIYSMSETGLLWRRLPYDTFTGANRQPSHQPRSKSRVCLLLCTNCTGSDRLPIWIIGHTEMPSALHKLNLEAMQVQWRNNPQAWISLHIMQEWLQSFYEHVGGKRVLLILDNNKVHQTALGNMPPPPNVHLQPVDTSPNLQLPLDLGITSYLKLCYRNTLLGYIVAGVDGGQNPIQVMSLYHTVCWISRNWRQDLTHATIYKAFRRSTLLEPQIGSFWAPRPPDLTPLYNKVTAYNDSGRPAMSLEDYQNSTEEVVIDPSSQMFPNNIIPVTASDPDEAEVPMPSQSRIPSPMETINAIQTVTRYMQHQPSATPHDIEELERFERFLNRVIIDQQQQ